MRLAATKPRPIQKAQSVAPEDKPRAITPRSARNRCPSANQATVAGREEFEAASSNELIPALFPECTQKPDSTEVRPANEAEHGECRDRQCRAVVGKEADEQCRHRELPAEAPDDGIGFESQRRRCKPSGSDVADARKQ
jgi:hypothetical protein